MQLNLSDNIKKFRKEMDLTQEGLAEAFGVTVGAVSKWESGSTVPDIMTLLELADFFNISMDVLLGYNISSKSIDDITARMSRLLKERRYDEAITEADKALVRYPGNFKIIYHSAVTYNVVAATTKFRKYKQKTIELYQQALKYISQNDDPDVSEFAIRRQLAEIKSEDHPEESLEELGRINYMGITDVNIATILMNMGKDKEAMERNTRVLVSILVKCTQFASNSAIVFMKSGKSKDMREAVSVLDWCNTIYEATGTGKISYLTKMQAVLMILKAMCLSCLKDYSEMRLTIDNAYKLARAFDEEPTNDIYQRIKFWHAGDDYKPTLYDELGQGAVEAIDDMFSQEPDPLPVSVTKKMDEALKYWKKIKES